MKTFVFSVYDDHAPALRSAIEELVALQATRLETLKAPHQFETAHTRAMCAVTQLRLCKEITALGAVAAAVGAQVHAGDKHFIRRGT